jgi:hypothetical protein
MDLDTPEAKRHQRVLCGFQTITLPQSLPRSRRLMIRTHLWYHQVHLLPSLLVLKHNVICLPSEVGLCLQCPSISDLKPFPRFPHLLSPRTRIMEMTRQMKRLEDKARSRRNVLIVDHIRKIGMPTCCRDQVLVLWPLVPSGTDVLLPLLLTLTLTTLLSPLPFLLLLLLLPPPPHLLLRRHLHLQDQDQ